MKLDPIAKQKLAVRTAFIAGIFSVIVSSIMLLNYWQLERTDPIENKLMANLVQQLENDRQNEALKEEIRNLDLMARKAYFTKQWQIRTGGYLLIGSMILMVIGLREYYSLRSEVSEPENDASSLQTELLISRRWILSLVLVLFGIALAAAFLSSDHLDQNYNLVEGEAVAGQPEIEEITVVSQSGTESTPDDDVDNPDEQDAGADEEMESIPEKEEPGPVADSGEEKEVTEKETALKAPSTNEIRNNFPSFRGPYGLGIAHDTNTPVDWDGASGKNILWKTKIPLHGYNSPIIWGNKLFVSGANQNSQVVYCYNSKTGDLLWQHEISGLTRAGGSMQKPTEDTGYAAATLATDGRYVTAIFASGDVACLDMNGTRIWAKNLGIPDNHYGHSSSLLIWKNLVLVQFDDNRTGKVLALDIASGNEVWSTLRESKISWASPILIEVDNQKELILTSSPHVASYNPETGAELWKVEALTGEVGPSPAFSNGKVYATNEYAQLVAIIPGKPPEIVWATNEYLSEVSSPVASDGMLILATSYGVIVCYDTETGEILWEYECDQGIYSSPVITDGKVYLFDLDGKAHIFQLTKTMQLVAQPELGEDVYSTPAFASGNIYIRGAEYLYCIGKE